MVAKLWLLGGGLAFTLVACSSGSLPAPSPLGNAPGTPPAGGTTGDSVEEDAGAPPMGNPVEAPPDAGGGQGDSGKDSGTHDSADAGSTAKVVLDVTWQGQQTYYWCGPASTRMALTTQLTNPPSQQALANFMGTTTAGTDDIGLVADALNHYMGVTSYATRTIDDNPTQAQQDELKKNLLATIGGKHYPMVGNVISGWRPPGYPSGTIYHYIAIVGYDENGDKALIADPAGAGAGGSGWGNVPKTYWVATTDLGVWIGGKGYAF